jgi:hypothetical protein
VYQLVEAVWESGLLRRRLYGLDGVVDLNPSSRKTRRESAL